MIQLKTGKNSNKGGLLLKKSSFVHKLINSRYFCLFWLIFAFVYVTWYGFLKDPFHFTSSMIGLEYPLHFKLWGLFSSISFILNITYMYRKNGYTKKLGRVLMYAGCACIMITVHIPSTEIMSLQLVAHWSTALLFGALNAGAIAVFLYEKSRQSKRMLWTLIVFVLMLVAMITLLIIFGKNGVIESIPMWGAYAILFLINYTGFYKEKNIPIQAKEKIASKAGNKA